MTRRGAVFEDRFGKATKYAAVKKSCAHRETLVATGAPSKPSPTKGGDVLPPLEEDGPKMNSQFNSTFRAFARSAMYTGGARMCCDCKYLVATWVQ